MASTTVQLPDDLYERATRFSDEHHLSLEETMQRALELLLEREPQPEPEPAPRDAEEPWKLPVADLGEVLVPIEKLRDLLFEEESNRWMPRE